MKQLLLLSIIITLPSVARAFTASGRATARIMADRQRMSRSSSSSSSVPRRTRSSCPPMFATTNSTADHQQKQQQQQQQHQTAGSGSNSIGRVLEGGKVIDFGAVKGSDQAETALQRAKNLYLAKAGGADGASRRHVDLHHTADQLQPHHHDATVIKNADLLFAETSSTTANGIVRILGINDDVIHEVGHELGTFADPEAVQSCAAYLRSTAPAGMFQPLSPLSSILSASDDARRLLNKAYAESGEVTGAFAKTFYMGTMLLGEEARKSIWAIYVWCRRTDEIVDAPRGDDNDTADLLLRELSEWEVRLEQLFAHGTVVDVYDLCLLDVRIRYPTLDIQPFKDMIRGMLMDVPGLGQERYENFDDLHLYCYRVAGTVGVMSLPIFGCADGYDDITAREPALSLGVAFQLTNILRDVGEDAKQRGRVYLPQEDLRRFGVTEQQIHDQRLDENYANLMKFQIERARMYYARARRGVFMLAPESRLPVQASLDAYGGILDKIEENDYDSLTKRAYVDKWEKLSVIPFSWYRTLDISRNFPLPGDTPVKEEDIVPSLRV